MRNLVQFLFSSLFIFWMILCLLEWGMPGFAIYYINLNWLLFFVIFAGLTEVILAIDARDKF